MTTNDIYDIFVDYYGDSKVDLQNNAIIVYWPEVTVENEENDKVTIWDLFCNVQLGQENNAVVFKSMTFLRSTYNKVQWDSNYCHSHVSWYNHNPISQWNICCLGKGPLRKTTERLKTVSTELEWKLYVWELDKYVHVESLKGGPYRKIRKIGYELSILSDGNKNVWNCKITNLQAPVVLVLKPFMRYLLNNNIIKISYQDGVYKIGEDINELIITLSNTFISWYNSLKEKPCSVEILNSYFLSDCSYTGVINYPDRVTNSYAHAKLSDKVGLKVLRFKGRDVFLKEKGVTSEPIKIKALKMQIIEIIVYTIVKFINVNYGKIA